MTVLAQTFFVMGAAWLLSDTGMVHPSIPADLIVLGLGLLFGVCGYVIDTRQKPPPNPHSTVDQ